MEYVFDAKITKKEGKKKDIYYYYYGYNISIYHPTEKYIIQLKRKKKKRKLFLLTIASFDFIVEKITPYSPCHASSSTDPIRTHGRFKLFLIQSYKKLSVSISWVIIATFNDYIYNFFYIYLIVINYGDFLNMIQTFFFSF